MCPALGHSLRALYVLTLHDKLCFKVVQRHRDSSEPRESERFVTLCPSSVSDILAVSVLETTRTEWQRLRKQQLGFVSSTYVVHDRHRSLCLELLQCYI